VTAITMFSNMELFSGANQLMDMTMRDKTFADKLDLINDKWAFMEKKHDTLEKKVFDPQVLDINYLVHMALQNLNRILELNYI
jgi:hypothetical protein